MTRRNAPSLLQQLPFPLFAWSDPTLKNSYGRGLLSGDKNYTSYLKASRDELDLAFQSSKRRLIDIRTLASQSEREQIAKENQLVQLHQHCYVRQGSKITPMLRATALAQLIPSSFRQRSRISRNTAAWIWGYEENCSDPIHLDFDRLLRLNVNRARAEGIQAHQVRTLAFDAFILGNLAVTTPLRTAVDLLLYDTRQEADKCLRKILNTETSMCQPHKIVEVLDSMPYIRGRRRALSRLEGFLAEAESSPAPSFACP